MQTKLYNGDCKEVLKSIQDNSIDSIVTDPPYELGFMGKSWDASGIAYDVEMWKECLRVLKPGGHLLSFGGSRTYHRMACAIEDAGFQIRDQIMWIYGSGFPKSHNISKAIDKAAGVQFDPKPASGVGFMNNNDDGYNTTLNQLVQIGESTAESEEWNGWGTALKPAHEPIVMARKPPEGTVANNVLTHGVGGINIDGCRVDDRQNAPQIRDANNSGTGNGGVAYGTRNGYQTTYTEGRFPANFIHDGSEEVLQLFPFDKPDQSAARFFYCAKASKKDRNEGLDKMPSIKGQRTHAGGLDTRGRPIPINKNHHPTVKPTELMRYLVRMITPPDGTVLDPFTGSGSTGKAAVLEGFNFVGIEQLAEYIEIALARIKAVVK